MSARLSEIELAIAAIRKDLRLIEADMDLLLEEWQKHAADSSAAALPRLSTAARFISHLSQQRLDKEKLLAKFEERRLGCLHQMLAVTRKTESASDDSQSPRHADDSAAKAARESSRPQASTSAAAPHQANTATH